jgi:SAM-dependent methyltransferase
LSKAIGPRLTAASKAFIAPRAPRADPGIERRDRERLRARATVTPLRLHIGCGPRVLKDWLNIDRAFEPYESYLEAYGDFYRHEVRGTRDEFFAIDVTEGLPLPDRSVAVIFHEDFIEHLSQRDAAAFLAEAWRVLQPGGGHRINTPDLGASMRRHSDFSRGLAGTYVGEWDRQGHINVLTPAYLAELAAMTGYSRIEFGSRDQSIIPGLPSEYRPGPDRDDNANIFADLIK